MFLLPRKDERDVEDLEQALADIEAEIDDEKKGGANEFSAMVAESGRPGRAELRALKKAA